MNEFIIIFCCCYYYCIVPLIIMIISDRTHKKKKKKKVISILESSINLFLCHLIRLNRNIIIRVLSILDIYIEKKRDTHIHIVK